MLRQIFIPLLLIHADRIDVDDALSQPADHLARLPDLVVYGDMVATVKSLAGMKACRSGV